MKKINDLYHIAVQFNYVFWKTDSRGKITFLSDGIHRLLSIPATLKNFTSIKEFFSGKNGLEIGGFSPIFAENGLLPIYTVANNIDNCNFSRETLWEGKIIGGLTFNFYRNKYGRQFICESSNMKDIKSESYDFVACSHVIEHIANPLKALLEWKRLLKNHGVLLLIVPHKEGTFDHKRPITPLEHLVEDYQKEIDEDDKTHLLEILLFHDLSLDMGVKNRDCFVSRSKGGYENRCLHHHVFTTASAILMLDYIELKVQFVQAYLPWHIIICCQKIDGANDCESAQLHNSNMHFLRDNSSWRLSSPFSIDKKPLKSNSVGRVEYCTKRRLSRYNVSDSIWS